MDTTQDILGYLKLYTETPGDLLPSLVVITITDTEIVIKVDSRSSFPVGGECERVKSYLRMNGFEYTLGEFHKSLS